MRVETTRIPQPKFRANRQPDAAVNPQNAREARAFFAHLFDDERQFASYADEFFRLGARIAGRDADEGERAAVYRKYIERISRHSDAREGVAPGDRGDALSQVLEEMRAENLRVNSSAEARRAHAEVESRSNPHDDPRALYNPQDGRSRAEHASHLNAISQEARDRFERGATIYGDTLVIPRESTGRSSGVEQVRAGSHAHAVREFTPLVGSERAKELAAEFVELGRSIAGRTGDGTSRLIVFQTFYHEITHDPATGKRRAPTQAAEQIEPTLERMRLLARAMRAEEWKRERAEFVAVEDWERGFEARQRDAEHETHGRLTYRIESVAGLEPERDDAEEHEREHLQPDLERSEAGALPTVEYERVRLDNDPPRLPDGLNEHDERRLRYEIVPRIDRQLESGARPRDIIGSLYREERAEESRALDEKVTRILAQRTPDASLERAVTRAEELRALYVLQALLPDSAEFAEQREKIASEITSRAPSERERVEAVEAIGVSLATEYRVVAARLRAYEAAETEAQRLHGDALSHQETVRAGAEFQALRRRFADEERERHSLEREALKSAADAQQPIRQGDRTEFSAYSELVGEQPSISPFARLRQTHERERTRAHDTLADMLIAPAIAQAQNTNSAEIEKHRLYFSRLTGSDLGSAQEARAALAPRQEAVRASLHRLHAERSRLNVETERVPQRYARPVFISLAAQPGVRLPLADINEYRTLTALARQLNLPTRVFESLYGREVTGAERGRDELYDFARQYVSYRAQDETTRLGNENRLFREFRARLDGARTTEELRATVNAIRQENYRRATHPEEFAEERREERRRNEQTRRPLTFTEMRALLFAPTPAHYSDEMRELRLSRGTSAHDKTTRLASLERGTLGHSPACASSCASSSARGTTRQPALYATSNLFSATTSTRRRRTETVSRARTSTNSANNSTPPSKATSSTWSTRQRLRSRAA